MAPRSRINAGEVPRRVIFSFCHITPRQPYSNEWYHPLTAQTEGSTSNQHLTVLEPMSIFVYLTTRVLTTPDQTRLA